jgi:phosphoribosylformylglycinamidine synthase
LIEKPEHVTTQWFKDEGDVIILLGDVVDSVDPLLGLGGSAYLQCLHGLKTGVPPRCDLEREVRLDHTLLGFIHCGLIKSAHDCSEGGLAVALAESCISRQIARGTPGLIGAAIDLTPVASEGVPVEALLFGETQGRVVVSVAPDDVVKVTERAKILGVPVARIGTVGGSVLSITLPGAEFLSPTAELHDLWWNAIDRAMTAG